MEEPKMPADVHDTIYEAIQLAMNNLKNRDDHAYDPLINTEKLIEALDWCMAYGAFLYEKDNIQGRDQMQPMWEIPDDYYGKKKKKLHELVMWLLEQVERMDKDDQFYEDLEKFLGQDDEDNQWKWNKDA